MKIYDQAEIGPVNEASLILLNLINGTIILDEQRLYKWWELLVLFFCAMICMCGIYIIVQKPYIPFLGEQKKFRRSEETENTIELESVRGPGSSGVELTTSVSSSAKYKKKLRRFDPSDREAILKVL